MFIVLLRLYVNWRFMRGIEAQFLALQKGFSELIPQHLLKAFDHKELEVHSFFFLFFLNGTFKELAGPLICYVYDVFFFLSWPQPS